MSTPPDATTSHDHAAAPGSTRPGTRTIEQGLRSNGADPGSPVPSGIHEDDAPADNGGLLLLDDPTDAEAPPAAPAPYRVTVIRSENRRKTVSARVTGGAIEVRIPSWLPPADEQRVVNDFVDRFEKRRRCWQVDLGARARGLAAAHDLPEPRSITWSTRQRQLWGSCSVLSGDIRIAHRLAEVPPWVLDYVIVHELAHLTEAKHTPAFHALVNRYPRAQRAIGYLQAFQEWSDRAADGVADRAAAQPPDSGPDRGFDRLLDRAAD